MAVKLPPKLLVMFDTNSLFTQVASDLVRNDIKRIVKDNSEHPDLVIEWYLPQIVVSERKYQMLNKARDFLPTVQKLEKLLGHQFGVGEDTLELHVDKVIKDGIEECSFKIAPINTNEIDWEDVISRSVKREPPFESSEKEKGFRDSVIAHTFVQLHQKSPTTPSICRLALVTEDKRLTEYLEKLTFDKKNVRILPNLDELESLINTLVSTVSEEFAAVLSKKAEAIFFEENNEKTFYYKEKIREKIAEQYTKHLRDTIKSELSRENGTWWISKPIFIKKEKQKIFWTTTISVDFEIYHYEEDALQKSLIGLAEILGKNAAKTGLAIPTPNNPPLPPAAQGLSQGLLGLGTSRKKVTDLTGKDKFEIHWSTTLSSAQNLVTPKFEKVEYLGNNLTEGGP